jgi:hypothetical protein
MTLQIEPKTTTRRDLLMIAGAAAATGGAALALGSDAVAQTAGGRIRAIGFDAFTILTPLSVGAVIDEYLLGKSFDLNTFSVDHVNAPLEDLDVKPDAMGTSLPELARYVTV